MSVISSRTTSIASILKCPGTRAKLVGTQNRVNFKLPKNLKNLLTNYENGNERKVYDDLICILKNANIKDDELIELLVEVRQSISLLGPTHKIFIEALLSINWTNRCHEATTAYKEFLEDLVCVHIYHCKLVLDKLISQFKPSSDDIEEWKNNEPRKEEIEPLDHIHDVIRKCLMIVPMSCTLLLQSLSARYPYFKTNTHSHEIYFYSLLRILDYAPQLRSEILSLIINRLIILDVNAPRSEIENHRENEMDDDEDEAVFHIDSVNETDDKTRQMNNSPEHPLAHSLDSCMEMLFGYIYNVCHPNDKLDMEAVKKLYFELLPVFESVILPTYASHHVQFIIFYICSFKVTVMEAFLNWLWHKVSNPNVAPVIRQSAVAYIASLVARANYISINLITRILREMSDWAHSYISAQDSLECANSDVRVHTVFYSVCQALFYIVAFRHKDLVDTKKNLLFLQALNFTKIVTCRLNPLKVCLPVVVQHFAAVTRAYQLAYCYSVIEHNSRSNLPVLQTSNRFTTWLDTFFPFDPYVLQVSGLRISNLYLKYQGSISVDTTTLMDEKEENDDEDDYMEVSFSHHHDVQNSHMDKFSYSTSPGFIHS